MKNIFDLTKRETEIKNLIIEGYNKHKIGKILNISIFTVECHTRNILDKEQVHSKVELLAKEIKRLKNEINNRDTKSR